MASQNRVVNQSDQRQGHVAMTATASVQPGHFPVVLGEPVEAPCATDGQPMYRNALLGKHLWLRQSNHPTRAAETYSLGLIETHGKEVYEITNHTVVCLMFRVSDALEFARRFADEFGAHPYEVQNGRYAHLWVEAMSHWVDRGYTPRQLAACAAQMESTELETHWSIKQMRAERNTLLRMMDDVCGRPSRLYNHCTGSKYQMGMHTPVAMIGQMTDGARTDSVAIETQQTMDSSGGAHQLFGDRSEGTPCSVVMPTEVATWGWLWHKGVPTCLENFGIGVGVDGHSKDGMIMCHHPLLFVPARTLEDMRLEELLGPKVRCHGMRGSRERLLLDDWPYKVLVTNRNEDILRFVRVGWSRDVSIEIPLDVYMHSFGRRFKECGVQAPEPEGMAYHLYEWRRWYSDTMANQELTDAASYNRVFGAIFGV